MSIFIFVIFILGELDINYTKQLTTAAQTVLQTKTCHLGLGHNAAAQSGIFFLSLAVLG